VKALEEVIRKVEGWDHAAVGASHNKSIVMPDTKLTKLSANT